MITLIGGAAIHHHFPDYRRRKDSDIDYQATTQDDYDVLVRNHSEEADIFFNEALAGWDWGTVATPEELYTMKVSHSFWEIGGDSRNWQKHMDDIVFLQRKGVKFNRELYDILYPMHKAMHGKKKTSLAQNAKNFFGDAVQRKYDHDSVHASIAYGDHPLFEDILVPGEDVMVDSSKFWAMDEDTKHMLVREEIYATALERILIPRDYRYSPMAAYAWSVQRTLTSLFKGEWALYLALNYSELCRPDCDYVARHLSNRDKLIEL